MTVESRRLVLHVEDDEDHAYLVRRCFRQLGDTCELLHFQTGESALEHIESARNNGGRRPDLVLLDLHLRQMSGLEVLRTLKALPWMRQRMADALRAGQARGTFPEDRDAYIVATYVQTSMQGLASLASSAPERRIIEGVVSEILRSLD